MRWSAFSENFGKDKPANIFGQGTTTGDGQQRTTPFPQITAEQLSKKNPVISAFQTAASASPEEKQKRLDARMQRDRNAFLRQPPDPSKAGSTSTFKSTPFAAIGHTGSEQKKSVPTTPFAALMENKKSGTSQASTFPPTKEPAMMSSHIQTPFSSIGQPSQKEKLTTPFVALTKQNAPKTSTSKTILDGAPELINSALGKEMQGITDREGLTGLNQFLRRNNTENRTFSVFGDPNKPNKANIVDEIRGADGFKWGEKYNQNLPKQVSPFEQMQQKYLNATDADKPGIAKSIREMNGRAEENPAVKELESQKRTLEIAMNSTPKYLIDATGAQQSNPEFIALRAKYLSLSGIDSSADGGNISELLSEAPQKKEDYVVGRVYRSKVTGKPGIWTGESFLDVSF